MSLFDSIISETERKFNLGGKAGTLLSALLAMITDENRGGFAGFLENFNRAGLGETASSWVGSNANTPISNEQLESALGGDTLDNLASQAGTDYNTASSATAYMIPRVVDALTPEGVIPQHNSVLSTASDYLIGNAKGATVAQSFDRIGTAAITGDAAINNRVGSELTRIDQSFEDSNSPMRWLLPLILLGLLLATGYWFCGKSPEPAAKAVTNVDVNANKVATNTN